VCFVKLHSWPPDTPNYQLLEKDSHSVTAMSWYCQPGALPRVLSLNGMSITRENLYAHQEVLRFLRCWTDAGLCISPAW